MSGCMQYDDWLDRFEPIISACNTPIIDLGCGSGNDTLYLTEHCKTVIPCDCYKEVVEKLRGKIPNLERIECFDMRNGLPFPDNYTSVLIANLSLHFFTEDMTFRILDEVKRILKPEGVLLFRLNSMEDYRQGKCGETLIEYHLLRNGDGHMRRFFDYRDIEFFFHDWEQLYLKNESQFVSSLQRTKAFWTGAMRVIK